MNKVRLLVVFVFVSLMFGLVNISLAGATGPIVHFDATTLALQNGDLVTAWGGQTAAGDPIYLTNQTPNGGPAVAFNGSDRLGENVPLSPSAAGDWIIAVVIKPDAIGAYHNIVDDDASNRPMLWIDPSFNYELNFGGGIGAKGAGTRPDGWDIVIADSKNNQLYVNSSTPNATGGGAIPFSATEGFDFFHRDTGQTFQGLVAELRIYNDRAAFGGNFAALHDELATKWLDSATTPVTLEMGTATFSQLGPDLNVDLAVDGITTGYDVYGIFNGWAIYNGGTEAQTAVWETSSDINASQLNFALYHTWAAAHSLGRFRLSYTTDDRSMFADGLNSGGDVTANWIELTGATISSTGGETFTILSDNSILVSGPSPDTTVYSVSFAGSFIGVTGIRLEALSDSSLPDNGPGRGGNGNFHLVEITLDATEIVTCPVGFYGTLSCQPAPAGSFVDTVGALTATPCAPGTYQDLEGQTSCLAAPIGFYVPTTGAAEATACPPGATTATTASTSLTDCNYPPTAVAGGPYLVAVDQQITLDGSASSDPDSDSLTETWTANGGTVAGNVYTASYVPGIYDVCLVVTDPGGLPSLPSEEACTIVVVYDPSGGFVTGGGWIDSPVNANYQYMQIGGKANFGFVAKYKKGANVPDGNTQFQFKTGDLNFHSTSYEWLVVAGNKAQFKGEGTINGQGSYQFMITADDDNLDTFRIHIWDDNGTVYDNGSQQALGGGSIVIHK